MEKTKSVIGYALLQKPNQINNNAEIPKEQPACEEVKPFEVSYFFSSRRG